ncbi:MULTISPECIES: ABC transporter permease [unclassified Bacillus (in: firmicutes)]|uniref:ABC transporter permease n=1 Tax=unclassified Bacillus (in: firmicutes) TaxID=185979 RepID=UPI00163B88C7|nr:ABC transporter permease [Bacillus sp. PAMC26543]QNH39653.1 ABC transporter permease [Bacillus sp. PAMC26543]
MLNLMKLELKKMKLGWYYRGAVIANLCILGFICLIASEEKKLPQPEVMTDATSTLFLLGTFVRSVFVVFASVLIAKLIISEYKNKTITVMFTYPISRKKLIAAKLLITGGLTFITIMVSEIALSFIFAQINQYYQLTPAMLSVQTIGQEVGSMAIYAASAACLSFIPLYFGMRKRSVPAAIISSVILTILISQQSPELSLATIIYIPLSLGAIGILIAIWSVRNIDREDAL